MNWLELQKVFDDLASRKTGLRLDVQKDARGVHYRIFQGNDPATAAEFSKYVRIAASLATKQIPVDSELGSALARLNSQADRWNYLCANHSGICDSGIVVFETQKDGSQSSISTERVSDLCKASALVCLELQSSFPVVESGETEFDSHKRRFLDHKIWSKVIFACFAIAVVVGFLNLVGFFELFSADDPEDEESPPVVVEAVRSEELKVTKVRPIVDQSTNLRPFVGRSLIALHWEVVLSNNGDQDLSILDYEALQIGEGQPIAYSGLSQGLYKLQDSELQPVQMPMIVPAGHSVALFVRLGVPMGPRSSELATAKFGSEDSLTPERVINFLRDEGIDLFGNPWSKNDVGVYSLPPIDTLNDPTFAIRFKTARSQYAEELVSWYKHGLFRLVTEP